MLQKFDETILLGRIVALVIPFWDSGEYSDSGSLT
jgi:hypothetical protein